ncbi:glycosyltransferase family 2 protein [Flavobacterium sp. '19STA2R22 D10 B1']|uniref:glycosyltransferase family 2 protein n=1 Tax=Flavobacterium aerium TaxID=3037261 RepID=UPI00278C366A|nr:glycosyltransferase family 2 protein [Flavobacterium sp. '19STA2R22 D10 B1']
MKLSVIILNYNVRYFLEQCVQSVQKALVDIEGEIIVIDNNSSDDSCAMMKKQFPEVILIENKENSGFSKGNNIGVEKAKGEYLCILNPDTVVAEDTFSKVLAFAEKQTDLGIVGVKLIDGTGHFLPECKRGIPTPWVAFTKIFSLYKLFPKTEIFGKYYAQHLSENETGKVDILVGAFMIMKTELYRKVGGFDEACFMYSDDIDLSYTILQENKQNYYFHETTVIHYKGESTVKDGTYMKRFQEAMRFFYKKHFKGSAFFELFMSLGIVFFSILKKFQGKPKAKTNCDSYILISESEKLLSELKEILQKNVVVHKIKSEKNVISQQIKDGGNVEIIFDNNFINYKTIIGDMQRLRIKGITFKIKPENTHYIIGSNSSNDRGEVINIENNIA